MESSGGTRLRLELGMIEGIPVYSLHGEMTVASFVEAVTPLIDDEAYASGPKVWDFREVGTAVTSADLFVMGKVVGDAFGNVPSVAAYVANPGVHFMKLETYRQARSDPRHKRRVFTTREEAVEWLKSQEVPDRPSPRRPASERSES